MFPPLRRFLIILALPLCLFSCSASGLINCEGNFIYNPDSFTAEQQEWIKNSSARWNNWVGHPVTSVRPGHSDVCRIDSGSTTKSSAIGQESSRLQNITVDVDDLKKLNILDKAHFEGVVLHEMGHALGYGHIGKDSEALMSSVGAQDFTDMDRVECIKHGMCVTLLPGRQANQ